MNADLDQIVARYLPRLHAYVRHRMGSRLRAREASADVVQSICREVLEERENFEYRSEAEFISWLLTAAMNKLRERGRHIGRIKRDPEREQPDLPPDASVFASLVTPSQEAARAEQLTSLEEGLQRLPEDYREVIVLARIVGLPHSEIASRMGRTVSSTRNLLGRALIRLVKEMDQDGQPSEGS